MKDATDFLLSEYESLKREVHDLSKDARNVEKVSITFSAIIWVWLITHEKGNVELARICSALPLLLTIIFGIYKYLLFRDVKFLDAYIEKIENNFLYTLNSQGTVKFGWEKHIKSRSKDTLFYILAILNFTLLIAINVFGIYYVFHVVCS